MAGWGSSGGWGNPPPQQSVPPATSYGWGSQPPQQPAPSQQGWGNPPPQQGWGSRPQTGWGAPQPQTGWGAPQSQAGFGQPQAGFGATLVPTQTGFGQPQGGWGAAPVQPIATVVKTPAPPAANNKYWTELGPLGEQSGSRRGPIFNQSSVYYAGGLRDVPPPVPVAGYREERVERWSPEEIVGTAGVGRLSAPRMTELYIYNVILNDQNPLLRELEGYVAVADEAGVAAWVARHFEGAALAEVNARLVQGHDLVWFYLYLFNQLIELANSRRDRGSQVTPWDVSSTAGDPSDDTPLFWRHLLRASSPPTVYSLIYATGRNFTNAQFSPAQLHAFIEAERVYAAATNQQPVALVGGVNLAREPNYSEIWLPMARILSNSIPEASQHLTYMNRTLNARLNLADSLGYGEVRWGIMRVVSPDGEPRDDGVSVGRGKALAAYAFPDLNQVNNGSSTPYELFAKPA